MSKKTDKPPRIEALHRVTARFRNREELDFLLCRKKYEEYYSWLKEHNGIENNEIGRRILYIRTIVRKLNTTEFAKKSTIHRSTINDLEKGKFKRLPKIETTLTLVEALEIDAPDFIDLKTDFETWKKVIFQKYAPFDVDGFIEIEESYSVDKILELIFQILDAETIYANIDGKQVFLGEKHIEILRRDIFNAFDIVKYLLGDGT